MASDAIQPQLELLPQLDHDGHASPTMMLRWRISPQLKKLLEDMLIAQPLLLLSVVHGKDEMDRYLYPLAENTQFIQFHRPGENTLLATIIWSKMPAHKLRQKLMDRRSYGDFDYRILRLDYPEYRETADLLEQKRRRYQAAQEKGISPVRLARMRKEIEQISHHLDELDRNEVGVLSIREDFFADFRRVKEQTMLTISVDQGLFASQPWPITRYLGNRFHWWGSSAKDQCQLRQRAMLAAVALPFAITGTALLWIMYEIGMLAIAATGILLGFRNLDFRPLRYPLTYETKDILRYSKPSRWWTKEIRNASGTQYEDRSDIFLLVNPVATVAVLILTSLLTISGFSLREATIVALISVSSIVLVPVIVISIVGAYQNAQDSASKSPDIREQERQQIARDLEQLTFAPGQTDLPSSKPTVRLIYQATKAKVCKPFAR